MDVPSLRKGKLEGEETRISHFKLFSIISVSKNMYFFLQKRTMIFLLQSSLKSNMQNNGNYLETMRHKTHMASISGYYEINNYILFHDILLRLSNTLSHVTSIWKTSFMLHTRILRPRERINLLKTTELVSAEARPRSLILLHHHITAHVWVPHLELIKALILIRG